MSVVKRFASEIFNTLPDRVNMFGRYMTGFGGEGLKLDKSTQRALVAGTEKPPLATVDVPEIDIEKHISQIKGVKSEDERLNILMNPPLTGKSTQRTVEAYGPGIPASGPVSNPYSKGSSQRATQTLGRYNAEVTPETVRVTDTYDMVNEFEDPDLVSGKFQPGKALKNLIATFDHNQKFDPKTNTLTNLKEKYGDDSQGYNTQKTSQDASPTHSKATQLARSLMYLLPVKPKGYDVDYTIQR